MTFDFGTQSVRAAIFNDEGECLVGEKQEYDPPYYSSKPGYAEQDPDYYYSCLCDCTRRIASKNPELMKRVAGITMTCFRDSAVLLDKDRKVIRPMVLWLDQRYARCEDKLPLWSRFLFGLVGMSDVVAMNRRRTIANWIKENEPDNFAKIDKYPDGVLAHVQFDQGAGLYFCGGRYERVRWIKEDPASPLRIVDNEGNEVDVKVNPGASYIAVVADEQIENCRIDGQPLEDVFGG